MQIIDITNKFHKFTDSLDHITLSKVLRVLDLLEKYSYELSMPHSKKIDSNLFELRVKGKHEIRIFYCFHKNKICILHYFVKKSQKTPHKDLRLAQKIRDDII